MKKSYISYFEKFKFFYLLISILLNFSEINFLEIIEKMIEMKLKFFNVIYLKIISLDIN